MRGSKKVQDIWFLKSVRRFCSSTFRNDTPCRHNVAHDPKIHHREEDTAYPCWLAVAGVYSRKFWMTLAINWIFTTGFHSKLIQLDLHTDIEAVLRWLLKLIPDCFFRTALPGRMTLQASILNIGAQTKGDLTPLPPKTTAPTISHNVWNTYSLWRSCVAWIKGPTKLQHLQNNCTKI